MYIKNGNKYRVLIKFCEKNNVGLSLIMFINKKLKLRKGRSKKYNK